MPEKSMGQTSDNTQDKQSGGVNFQFVTTYKCGIKVENPPHDFDMSPLLMLALVLQSAFIPDTKILSVLFISMPSLNKTGYIQLTSALDFVHYTNDFTSKPLMEFIEDVDNGKKKFLCSPDFISSLGHGKNTVENTRGTLRSLIEEGYSGNDVFGMVTKRYNPPVKAGLITGITVDMYNMHSELWRKDGFLSRILPFSYSHSPQTESTIIYDKLHKIHSLNGITFEINKKPTEPELTDKVRDKIQILALQLTQDKYVGAIYRPLEQVISMCKSCAVLRDSKEIEEIDIDIVRHLATYINRKGNPL